MNKFKILLSFFLLFVSGCSNIQDKPIDKEHETIDVVINDDQVTDESHEIINKQESVNENAAVDQKEQNRKTDSTNKAQVKNEDKQNISSSIGKNDSSNKNDTSDEISTKNENVENPYNQIEESSKENETKEEVKEDSSSGEDTKSEIIEKEECTSHKWDDSFGNSPQFSELIFDNFQDCENMMNDIYNNFITEEKTEYEKYYKNSKGQWMSSIAASDIWCECGAHAYAIFITYE